jgi:hypothetical protein
MLNNTVTCTCVSVVRECAPEVESELDKGGGAVCVLQRVIMQLFYVLFLLAGLSLLVEAGYAAN